MQQKAVAVSVRHLASLLVKLLAQLQIKNAKIKKDNLVGDTQVSPILFEREY